MSLRLCQIQYGTIGQILFSHFARQEVSVKSKQGIFGKIFERSYPGTKILNLRQKKRGWLSPPGFGLFR